MATTSTLDLINSPDSIISITTDTDVITIVTGDQGPVGTTGAQGVQGIQGLTGVGVAPGGFIRQALVKASNIDYDTTWTSLFDSRNPGPIGDITASTGRFTTIQSTVSTGTPPFIVSSTTPVVNLSIGGNAATATNVAYSGLTGSVPIWNQNTTGTASNITDIYAGSITSSQVTTALTFTPENAANRGVANGYAPLDSTTKISSAYLPSYVDDVVEYANFASLPTTGETGKIYVSLETNKTYRWSGTVYIEINVATNLSSPGAIGGITPAAGTFTTLISTDQIYQNKLSILGMALIMG